MRDEINRSVARGRVTVRVTLHAAEDQAPRTLINEPLARAYTRELRRVAKELNLAGDLSLDVLLRAPGVLQGGAMADRFMAAIGASNLSRAA